MVRPLLLLFLLTLRATAETAGFPLINAETHNGSFESTGSRPPYRPWILQAPSATERKIEVREGSETLPAADGEHYLAVRATNEDQKANVAGVILRSLPLNDGLTHGRRFRLSWQARSRSGSEYRDVSAELRFHAEGEARPLLLRRMKEEPVGDKEWSRHQLEVVYPGERMPDFLSLQIVLTRRTLNHAVQEMEGYIDDIRLEQLPGEIPQAAIPLATPAAAEAEELPPPPIPIRFQLEKAGLVTLVIEDQDGVRVRNLVAAEPFEAGEAVAYWDGMDEGVPIPVPGASGAQAIRRSPVPEGRYRVRGFVRDPLKLTYEMTAYPNTGNPPWITERLNGAGGWLADHGVPTACAYIPVGPRGNEEVLIASPVAESGQALAWVDLDGNKVGGRFRLGGHWTGATHLARDRGEKRHPDIYLYTLQRWSEMRMMGLTASGALTLGMIPLEDNKPGAKTSQLTGLAVHNGRLVYSTDNPGRLYFYDTLSASPGQRATLVGETAVEHPWAVAFDTTGRLLVLNGQRLLRYPSANLPLGKPETLIGSGLEEPRAIALDDSDRIYIADWGDRHQVLIFDPEGKPLRTIGKPGRPASGPFDEEKLNFPYGLTVDSRGQLWTAGSRWRTPKTVTVWDAATGKHLRSYYGPSEYGGGGNLDPADSERFLYANGAGGVEFHVDWKEGKATPRAIYWLASETPAFESRWKGPDYARRIGEHRYITNEFGAAPTTGHKLAVWKDRSPETVQPLFVISSGHQWANELGELGFLNQFEDFTKGGRDRHFLLNTLLIYWSDGNGNGKVDAEELAFRTFPREEVEAFAGVSFGEGYEVLIAHRKGVLSLKPRSVSEDGVPLYDLADCQSATGASDAGGVQALRADDGTLVITGGPMKGVRDGKLIWRYHSQWPSLHAGHAAPKAPEYSGQLLATTRLLGPIFRPKEGEGGLMWAINSDKGVVYLLTGDGLFVDHLFAYGSEAQRWDVPEATRGMDVTRFNPGGETFWPTINATPDGRVMLVEGKNHSSFVEVHGLESIHRFTAPEVSIGKAEQEAAARYQTLLGSRKVEQKEAIIARVDAVPEGADLSRWKGGPWLAVMRGRLKSGFSARDAVWTAASLALDDKNLYVALRSRQTRGLLENSGGDLQSFFSTGGGLDIQLSTRKPEADLNQPKADPSQPVADRRQPAEGDIRLIIAESGGKPKAVLYRPVVKGTKEPVRYESPVGKTEIDRIEEVSGQIGLASRKATLSAAEAGAMLAGEFREYLVTIPLATLGWNPEQLPETRGDIGVLIGRGGATVDRSYWHNQQAGLVNDLPGEARLIPALWGPWRVEGERRK